MKTTHRLPHLTRLLLPALLLLSPVAARAAKAPSPLDQGRTFLRLGQPKEALDQAEAAVKHEPGSGAAQLLHGKALLALEQPNNAIEALSEAARLEPKNAEAQALLGDAYFYRAGVELREWLKKNRVSVGVHTDSGVVSTLPGGGHTHTTSFTMETVIPDRSANRMKGKDWEAYTGHIKDALKAYTAALAIEPANKIALRGKGLCQIVLGKWGETAEAFETAGAPAFDSFIYDLAADHYDTKSMSDAAYRVWAAVEKSDPTNAWAYWYQRVLYDESRRGDWRRGYFDAMASLFGDAIKGNKDARLSSPKDALKNLDNLIEKHPEYAPAWRGRAIAAAALKDSPTAKTAFTKAIELDPKDWFSHLQLGMMLLGEKDPAAEAILAKAAQENPENAVAWQALGIAIERTKDLNGAVYCYERAAALAPTSAEAHYSLGALQLARREDAKALVHLQRYLDLKPDAPDATEVRDAIAQIHEIIGGRGKDGAADE